MSARAWRARRRGYGTTEARAERAVAKIQRPRKCRTCKSNRWCAPCVDRIQRDAKAWVDEFVDLIEDARPVGGSVDV
jgi:hypothetical protein